MVLDTTHIRKEFPILDSYVYLDNASTTQKPRTVIDRLSNAYLSSNANVHRGMYPLAEHATEQYESARTTVQRWISAQRPEEVIFTKGATEGLNIVAQSWGKHNVCDNDVIVLSVLEHHSNIVPWLQLQHVTGCTIKWIDVDDHGDLQMEELDTFLDEGNVKMVSITAQSNVTGFRPDLPTIIQKAHDAGSLVCIDAAQSIAHQHTNVTTLDCDFLVFSGHKMYGPTGIGVLYGKHEHLDTIPPLLGGGMMIREVHRDHFTCADLPAKFEAGTPPVVQAHGLATAISWLEQFDMRQIEEHETALIEHAASKLSNIEGLHLIGSAKNRHGCMSFTIDGIHPHDLTEILGSKNICLRAGHHCTQPLHESLDIIASTRLSVALYNTADEIERTAASIQEAQKIFVPTP